MRNFKKHNLWWLASLWLAACVAPVTPTAPPTAPTTPTPAPSATPAFTPTVAATATLRRFPTYTPSMTKTPSVTSTPPAAFSLDNNWNVTAWLINSSARYSRWVGENQVGIGNAYDSLRFDSYFDAESLTLITLTPWPEQLSPDPFRFSFSPNKAYYLECTETSILLHRANGEGLIGQAVIKLPIDGCYLVDWASDSSKMAFVSASYEIYVWQVTDSQPKTLNILKTYFARWSPGGDRLLVVSGADAPGYATVQVATADGVLLPSIKFEVSAGNGWATPHSVSWFDENIISNSRFGITWRYFAYYSTNSGRLIAEWVTDIESQQNTDWAPDGRWVIIDRHGGTWAVTTQIESEYYGLIDFSSEEEFRLTQIPNQLFDFLAWSPNSSTFYTISRPVSETAQASAEVPFGLLALNPQTRTFTQLFEQAVFAALSPDQTRAWVVFPAKREGGALGLDGGVFDMQAGTLTARQYVADEVFYGNPAEGALLPAAWNHAGTRLVFADARGGLMLVNVNGEVQTLTATLPIAAWPQEIRLEWAPDDSKLLVHAGERAWVVEMP